MLEIAKLFFRLGSPIVDSRTERFTRLMNAYRDDHGIPPVLCTHRMLELVATVRAWEMATERQPLAHEHTDGTCPYMDGATHPETRHELYYFRNSRYAKQNGRLTTGQLLEGWQNSPPHNEGLLDGTIRSVGIAYWRAAIGEVVVMIGSDRRYRK